MSADVIRRAAAKIRETAQGTTPGPWVHDRNGVYGSDRRATYIAFDADTDLSDDRDLQHAALWSPDVADLVASALEGTADLYELLGIENHPGGALGLMAQAQNRSAFQMLTLARRILGEDV